MPGCLPDRALLSLSSFVTKDSRSFFTGDGSHFAPYHLHTFGLGIGKSPKTSPTVISINDDPDQVFQSSPPSPVDYAIILRNLKRIGIDRVAISFPLLWEQTDAVSLAALDRQLDAIPSLATSAPLTRGAVPAPIPPAFRRASVSLSRIRGDTELLPAVNRIALPDVILGNKTSLAGFTRIESEPKGTSPFLLARWGEDQAVLSFLLIAALDHYQVPPSALDIRLGEFISLGARGPFIPIDEHGRLDFAIPKDFSGDILAMESLLKTKKAAHDKKNFQPAILRSDLSATEDAYATYAQALAPTIAALCDPTYAGEIRTFSRLPVAIEIILLLALALIAYGLLHSGRYRWKFVAPVAIAGIITIHFIAITTSSTWLPTLPALLAFVTYAALGHFADRKSKNNLATSENPTPAARKETPQEPAAKKTAVKKTPTRKNAAKKTPTRKTAKKATKTPARKTAKKAAKKAGQKNPRKATKKRTRKIAKKNPPHAD